MKNKIKKILDSLKPKKKMREKLIIGEVRDEKEMEELFSSMKSGNGTYIDHRDILLEVLSKDTNYSEEEKEQIRETLNKLKQYSRI